MSARAYLLSIVMLSLILGTLVYAVERPASASLLFGRNLYGTLPPLFGPLSGSLPSLTHALAFTLLSALALGSRHLLWLSGSLWASLEVAFEVGQHPHVSAYLARSGFGLSYFRYGTFDIVDLLASLVGVALALYFYTVFQKGAFHV